MGGMRIPPVRDFMTTSPRTIGARDTMAQAHRMMREARVRHLPVVDDDRLVGVVTAGDLHLMETLKDVDPEAITVEEAMSQGAYAVTPDTLVDEVVAEMARHKYGCAVVASHGKVVGILTCVDVYRAFAELLHSATLRD